MRRPSIYSVLKAVRGVGFFATGWAANDGCHALVDAIHAPKNPSPETVHHYLIIGSEFAVAAAVFSVAQQIAGRITARRRLGNIPMAARTSQFRL
jgi:hypothetical protein